ncbi:hypothetical protein TNCV_526691 [Trichonephila clavipes]|nr:hypothetical protein TNCV_526691 [Trichonephila clavipes]
MVEVKPINISLDQHSPGISVRTAISPTLTEEFIIHPSVYSEIEKLGHAKSDVLLSESGSSLSADLGVQFNSSVSFPNVSVSNVIKNCSCDLPYVKNFNTRNDSSSLIKDYKCNKIKSTKLKLSIILLWSPWKYRCGQRTVRMAVVACSKKQNTSLRAQAQLKTRTETCEIVEEKQKLLDIRAEKKRKGERERCASRRYLLNIIVKLICKNLSTF